MLKDLNMQCKDENIIRIKAAEKQNEGINVCGNCVRELYKNDYPDMG